MNERVAFSSGQGEGEGMRPISRMREGFERHVLALTPALSHGRPRNAYEPTHLSPAGEGAATSRA